MKICPNCNNPMEDNAVFCQNCGAKTQAPPQPQQSAQPQQPNFQQPNYQQPNFQQVPPQQYAPMYDPFDHTAEFDAKDISDNKVISMLVYLMGAIGIVIALLASSTSKYAAFHVRQALKFTVVELLVGVVSALLCWTFIVPIAAGIFLGVLTVIKFICFFQICSGKAKEPAIIRSLNFLK